VCVQSKGSCSERRHRKGGGLIFRIVSILIGREGKFSDYVIGKVPPNFLVFGRRDACADATTICHIVQYFYLSVRPVM